MVRCGGCIPVASLTGLFCMTRQAFLVQQAFRTARLHHQAGDFAQAEKAYRQVLDQDPSHAAALNGLGRIAARFGHHEAAKELFERALVARPGFPLAHKNLGDVLCVMRQYRPAIASYRRALELKPEFPAARQGLMAAEQALAVAEDPDYSPGEEPVWDEDAPVLEELAGNDTLFVLFSGLGVGADKPAFIFRKFLKDYPQLDKLFVRDISTSWYLAGLPGLTTDVESTADWLQEKMRRYERSVFMGCSAGAMGAMLYGELTGADKVLAFAPQTVLSEDKPRELNDLRWEARLRRLRAELGDDSRLDLKHLNPLSVAVDIHFPAGVAADRIHAERVEGEQVTHIAHDSDSHVIALELRDSGELKAIVDREVSRAADTGR